MEGCLSNLQVHFLKSSVFNPKSVGTPPLIRASQDDMYNCIGGLGDVGGRNSFGSRWMRVEDADQVEVAGVDPLEGM